MKRTSSDELLPTPTHLPESDLLPATLPDTSAEQAQSEPTLFNRTAANPSMEMYDDGEGVEENKVKAFEWYQKAADQGHAAAQFTPTTN